MQNNFKLDLIKEYGFNAYVSVKYDRTLRLYNYTWENPSEKAKQNVSLRMNSKTKLGYSELTKWIETLETSIGETTRPYIETINDVITAVKEGKTVCWSNDSYEVIDGGKAGFLVKCISNGHCVGLMHTDNVTSSYNAEDFYVKEG